MKILEKAVGQYALYRPKYIWNPSGVYVMRSYETSDRLLLALAHSWLVQHENT